MQASKFHAAMWLLAAAALSPVAAAAQETRGVTNTEIVVGTHQAMSGPLAGYGVPISEGLRMRFEEVNEKGGVHGRKIRLIVEDNQFNPARAAQVGNKLLNSDKVFAIIASLGTPTNVVVMEEGFKLNVPNLFPGASGRQMYEPFHRLKFAIQTPHYDYLRSAVKYMVEKKGKRTVCILSQDNDFGREIASGVEAQLKVMNMAVAAQATHKADDKDFSAQMSRLRDAKCDLIGLGSVIADTIGIMSTAKRMNWSVEFVGSSSVYAPETVALAQGVTDGLYGMSQLAMPYENEGTPAARDWYARFNKRFGHQAGFPAALGYVSADLFIVALERAGKTLNVDTLVAALEGIKDYRDPFDSGPVIAFSPEKRLGTNQGFLAQIQNGRWVKVAPDLSY